MVIRRATDKDIKGIMALLYQVAEVHHKGRPDIFRGGASKYNETELCEIIADPQTPVFVAVDEEGRVLGHAFCVLKQGNEHPVLINNKSLYIEIYAWTRNVAVKVSVRLCAGR